MEGWLNHPAVGGVIAEFPAGEARDCMARKQVLKAHGIAVDTFESASPGSSFKLNSDGLIPVIVQEYKTDQVLMMAYMNEEAYEATLNSGKMTYFSRSRQYLWLKGETSGHFQYVKSLRLDCDLSLIHILRHPPLNSLRFSANRGGAPVPVRCSSFSTGTTTRWCCGRI